MANDRYLLSPCCDAKVVVPVDVTVHRLVRGDGTLSKSITDTLKQVRWDANHGYADVNEAYCYQCGEPVAAPTPAEGSADGD